jgi:hypothetical protein
MATFPGVAPNPLGLKIELNLNGTWTTITQYVLQRDLLSISNMGRVDESSTIQASQLTLTLRNTGGRFTPLNAASPYYPYIVRNCQLRVSVSATSTSGVAYSGYRFYGEVSAWPPTSDISQNDLYVQVVVSGVWRRISQSNVTIGSAYSIYVAGLTGGSVPQSSWTMEDGYGSLTFAPQAGTSAATFTGTPSFAQDGTSFPGCDSLPQFNAARVTANVTSGGTPTDVTVRFALAVPSGGDSLVTTFSAGGELLNVVMPSGTGVKRVNVSLTAASQLEIQGWSATTGGTALWTGTISTAIDGIPVLVSVELTPSGGSLAWAMRIIEPGAAAVLDQVTGTQASSVPAAVTQVTLNIQGRISDTTFGELGVWYSVPSLVTAAAAIGGYAGEFAVVRFERLCTQFGIPYEVIGSTSAAMGPQIDDTLANLLQVIEATDGGLLYESTDQFGLGYRTLASMQNQSVVVTLNYAAGMLGAPLAATYDDQLLFNQWTVQNWDGYTAVATLTSGALSVQPVPNGSGLYAGGPLTVSASTHAQVNAIAQQKLFEGTVNTVRFPQVTVDARRGAAASLFATVPALRPGDYIQITNLPAWAGGGTALLLIYGWTETLNAFTWSQVFNTIPEEAFSTSYSPGVYSVVQAPTGTTAFGGSGGSGAISVSGSQIGGGVAGGIPTSTLSARSIGGVTSFIAAATPYDWTFAVSGTPADLTYFTAADNQTVPIAIGDTFTNSGGFGGPFTVTSMAAPSGGNVSVYFTPDATSAMSSGTVYGGKNGDTWVNTSAGNQIEQWENGAWTAIQFGPSALSFTAGGAKVTIAATAPGSPTTGDIWYNSSNGYEMEQWNGTAWVAYQYGSGAISATARQLGGIITTVAASAPGSPLAGDLWINTAAGNAIYQYSGSAWVLYQFGSGSIAAASIAAAQIVANTITAAQIAAGTITAAQIQAGTIIASLIAAGTITAAQIAAGTITAVQIAAGSITATQIAAETITAGEIAAGTILASNLEAGIVVATIVDGTTITGASLVADGTNGEVLIYSGTPASGNLIGAWSGGGGTDGFANSYPLGLMGKALTLPNLSSAPSAFSGASELYTDSQGGAHLLSSSGQDLVLDRSMASSVSYNLPNSTSPVVYKAITDAWEIYPNDPEVSTTYILETWGNGTWGGQTLLFALSVNGGLGGAVLSTTIGGVAGLNSGDGISFTIRLIVRFTTIGSSGVFHAHFSGTFGDTSNNRTPALSTCIEQDQSSIGLNTTVSNTLAIAAGWGSNVSGQNLQSYGNMFTRRSI